MERPHPPLAYLLTASSAGMSEENTLGCSWCFSDFAVVGLIFSWKELKIISEASPIWLQGFPGSIWQCQQVISAQSLSFITRYMFLCLFLSFVQQQFIAFCSIQSTVLSASFREKTKKWCSCLQETWLVSLNSLLLTCANQAYEGMKNINQIINVLVYSGGTLFPVDSSS